MTESDQRVTHIDIPPDFRELVSDRSPEGDIGGSDWLVQLPRLVRECLAAWELTAADASLHGTAALIVPVRRADDSSAVLKVTWPHFEAAHEHLALRRWDGRGAVRLLAADPSRWAMLLEPLHADHSLADEPIDQACAVIGGLLRDLDVPALSQSVLLSDEAKRWATTFADAQDVAPEAGGPPLPRRFLEQAGDLALDLARSPDVDARLVHTDLHYENVLAGDRAPWLAIDPKPLAAEAAFAVAPALWNRWEEAAATGDIRRALRRRLDLVCEAGGIDRERARAWSIVREALNAVWEGQSRDERSPAAISQKITTIKALQEP